MPSMPNPTGKHRPKRRHHGEGTVIRRKDRWRAKPWAAVIPWVDESGRRHTTWLSAASRDEAEQLRKDEAARIRRGTIPTAKTVASYMGAWLTTVDVGPGTWPRYRAHLDVRIAPTIGDVPLASLTPLQVRTAMMRWAGAPATRKGALRLLRAAMKQAVHDKLREDDPTAGIPYPRVPRKEPVTLTAEQARHLMETVAGDRFAPILVTTLGLGLRRGEALGLRTPDIDFRAGSVTIAKQLRYIPPAMRADGEGPYRLKATKTDDVRTVPLPPFVRDALGARIEERDREKRSARVYAPNDFVFCDPLGNSVPLETLYHWFKGALKRAGLPDMKWHGLRATTVTLLYELEVNEAVIMAIVGHRDLATTRLYKGRTPKAIGSAAERIGAALG